MAKEKKIDEKVLLGRIRIELQSIIDAVPSYIFVKDKENRFLRGNKAFAHSVGVPVTELPGRSAFDLYPEDLAKQFWMDDLEVIDSGKPKTDIVESGRSGEGAGWFSTDKIPHRNEKGEITGVVGIARDITARVEIERSLREKSDLLYSILQSLTHPFYVINTADYTIALANRASGLKVGEEAVTCYEHMFNRKRPCENKEICPLEAVKKTRQPFTIEQTVRDGDGTQRIVEMHAYPLFGKNGEVAQIIEYSLDITSRKKAEEALLESESRLQSFYDAAVEGIVILDEGKLIDVNRRFAHLLGCSREELIGRTVTDFIHEDDREMIDELIRSNSDRPCEARLLRKDEEVVFAEVWSRLVDYRGRQVRVTTINDITEQKKAVEALKNSEEKYRSLFEESRDSLFVTTREGRIADVNRAGIELLGLKKKEELLGLHLGGDFFDKSADVDRLMGMLAEEGFATDFEAVLRRRGGQELIALISGNILHDEEGGIRGYRVSIRDVTEQKRLHEHLVHAQKMESLGTLAGGIAHDINNVLTPILAHVGYMQLTLPDESPLREDLEGILRASNRARDLVSHILTFSRREEKKKQPVFLPAMVKETMNLLRATCPATISIESEVDDGCRPVLADPTEIHQILMNLCTNAEHALRGGGGTLRVALDTVDAAEDVDALSLKPATGFYARLTVADTGHGMDERTKARIFEPYFTTKAAGEGSGLGLAVVHGIVAAYGGGIAVESEPGEGSSLSVYLPTMEEDPLSMQEGSTSASGGEERILLVDDEKSILRIGGKLLRSLGYEVTTEDNSRKALELFKAAPESFDLIVTDQTLPQLTGTELMAEILAVRPELPVIICTGFSRNLDREFALQLGASHFLVKPFTVDALAKAVRSALDGQAP